MVLAVHQIPALLALTPYFHLLLLAGVAQALAAAVMAAMARQLMVMVAAVAVLAHLAAPAVRVTGLEKMAALALPARIPVVAAAAERVQMAPQEAPAILAVMAAMARHQAFLVVR